MRSYHFPVHGLLPKKETQAASFIELYPEHDGRGTVIAILDTGVDPGAAGLQVTSHGLPKIAELIDCTGSGDVQCSTIAKVAQETINGESFNHLTGLSGRKLKIGDWNNPTGEFRLGLKHSFDIFPKDVVERIKESRKKKFEIEHHRLRSTVQSKTVEEKDKAQEFSLLTECLDEMIKTYEDPGILMDCVVFHDGTNWRAALDLLENGDLRNAKLLTSYGIEHEYVCFDAESMLNLSVNIYDEGSLLSIVTCNGSHGTHVAAITAAYHPEDPSINGVAPGAQIVSLKIGETKVGTMETGQGLVRAAIELYRLKVDVANMSYGEGTSVPNQGKFIQILRDDVVNKGGCVFVSSAGNEGPALTTVGCPGGTTSGIISVGAYVSQSMMEASYAMLSNVTERPYTWSSRGPTPDGDFGVDIYAPGAAITSVPQYTLSNNKLMNGTSMSSPNCAGCVALLVSGLKQKNIDYTPYFIKWAIKKTGKSIGDDLGVNFIQVVDAWNAMLESKDELAAMLNYNITVKDSSGIVGRGIYLREIEETSGLQEFLVTITPEFPDAENPNKHLSKFEFVDQVALDPSESWISTPNFFVITNQGITFKVRVDPSKLATGLHTGKIAAVAIRNSRKVKLFDVPVFVTKPFIVADRESPSSFLRFENLKFKPGDLNRNFINVPLGANFVEINVTCQGRPTNANFLVYLVQLNPQTARYKFSQETYFVLSSPESGAKEEPKTFKQMVYPVIPNVTLELCLGQFWSSLDETVVSVEVKFHGVYCSVSSATNGDFGAGSSPGGANLLFNNGYNGFSRVDVSAPIRKESINPKLTFENLEKHILPKESHLTPLKSRDVLPNGKQIHQLILTYSFTLSESATVTPHFPLFGRILYESSVENFAFYLFNSEKKVMTYRDIFFKSIKLGAGEYTLQAQVASSSTEILTKLKSLGLVLSIKLAKAITPSIYTSLAECLSDGEKFKAIKLSKGGRVCFWIGSVTGIPSFAEPGDLLTGKLDVADEITLKESLFTAAYVVTKEFKEKKNEPVVTEKEPEKPQRLLLENAQRDLSISWLAKFPKEERDQYMAEIEKQYPDYLGLFVQYLQLIFADFEKDSKNENLKALNLKYAQKVIDLIDESDVARYFGVQHEDIEKSEIQKNKQKDYQEKRDALIWAYKARALAHIGEENKESFDQAMSNFSKWNTEGKKRSDYLLLWVGLMKQQENYGSALKQINTFLGDEKNSKDSNLKAIRGAKLSILQKIGWNLWIDYETRHAPIRSPGGYASF